jgi:hypothetical protein
MDPLNLTTMLYSDAEPRKKIFLPACSLTPTALTHAVDFGGPHLDGILTFKFESVHDLNAMLDIFDKSRAYFSSAQEAFREVKYVAAGGNATEIRTHESLDIHGVGLTLDLSRNGRSITVRSIAPGSPAALCDSVISVHDHLLKVDGLDVKHSCTSLQDVAKRIRGVRGTPVRLLLRRSHDVETDVQNLTPSKAKSKYEVVLRRGPPVDPDAQHASWPEADKRDKNDETATLVEEDNAQGVDAAVHEHAHADAAECGSNDEIEELESVVDAFEEQLDLPENFAKDITFKSIPTSIGHESAGTLSPQQTSRYSIYDLRRISEFSDGTELQAPVSSFHTPASPYHRMLESAGGKQSQARLLQKEMLDVSAPGRARDSTTEETSEKEPYFFPTDIGILLCAVNGRHIVRAIEPDAPQSVCKHVFEGDELLSVDGAAVAHASPGEVFALLSRASTWSFRLHVFCAFLALTEAQIRQQFICL